MTFLQLMTKTVYPARLVFAISVLIIACTDSPTPHSAPTGTENYIREKVPGSDLTRVVSYAKDGSMLEEGFIKQGVKEGAWTLYYPGKNNIKEIIHYVNGVKNGIVVMITEHGQVQEKAHYFDDQLDGLHTTYKFNRPINEANYKLGKLDGMSRIYFENNGKLFKEINYKNGEMDGVFRQYDDNGVLRLEYQYKNGKIKSGGVVTTSE